MTSPVNSATLNMLKRDFLLDAANAPAYQLGDVRAPHGLPCVVAIGAFDGCHRGHLELLAHAAKDARERGLSFVAVTFDPDPDEVLSQTPARKLTNYLDRIHLLQRAGAQVAVVPFTRELAALDHEAFFTKVLSPSLDIQAVHVGTDFRLGRGGASTVEVMRAWGKTRGIDVYGHKLLAEDGAPITATLIRSLLAQGKVEHAAQKLGRSYIMCGQVARGRGEGTNMGFPTANVELSPRLQIPANGVYAGYALVGNTVWPAAINAGLPPTFEHAANSAHLEANLLGCNQDLYGQEIALSFVKHLRPSYRFASVDELVRTVNNDIHTVSELLGNEALGIA